MKKMTFCLVFMAICFSKSAEAADYAIRNRSDSTLRFWLWCERDGDWATLKNNATTLTVGSNKRHDLEHHTGVYTLIVRDSDGIEARRRIEIKSTDANSFSVHAAYSMPADRPSKKIYTIERDKE